MHVNNVKWLVMWTLGCVTSMFMLLSSMWVYDDWVVYIETIQDATVYWFAAFGLSVAYLYFKERVGVPDGKR